MKLRYFFLWSLTVIFLLHACTGVLDISPDGNMYMEDVLKDPNKVEGMLNKCYDQIPMKTYWYFFDDNLPISMSDDGWSAQETNGGAVNPLYRDQTSASYHPMRDFPAENTTDNRSAANLYQWRRFWEQIRMCSQFIEVIDNAAVRNESDRGRFKAEAHLLRAFFYSELVKWFGKLPILDGTVSYDADFSELRRESVYDVVKFIMSDCDIALNTNELPWRIVNANDALRVTKALAWALKAQMMVFAASPLHNENQDHWEEAYQVCKDALAALRSNGYELYTQCTNEALYGNYGAQAYHQYFCENADYSASPRDRETIWHHKFGATFVFHVGYIGSNMAGTYFVGICPTQELVDAYETIDGKPVLDLSRPYLDEEFHLQPNYNPDNTLYDPNNPYANRDPRMEATIMHNGSKLIWDNEEVTVESYVSGRHGIRFDISDMNYTRTSYFHRKYVMPTACLTNWINSPPWKYYRLGEIMLDFAEAACEANHLAEAKAAADEIRARVNMPPLPANLNQNELRLRIRNERRIELAWEENRYFDLRRWQKPDGDLSTYNKWLTAMVITRNDDGSFSYQRTNISNNPRGGWQNRDLLLPLPLDECSRLEPLTGVKWQNPGW